MKVAVIGAGTMGQDIALIFAAVGIHVILKDTQTSILDMALSKIKSNLRFYRMAIPEYQSLDKTFIEKYIHPTTTYEGFSEVDWVIENIPEEWELKRNLYIDLVANCDAKTRYAVNTSCISITKIAGLLPHPENVIGLHFMNPVPMKPTVEAIQGFHTSTETVEAAKSLLKLVNKKMILVNDSPGFVANRLSHLFMNEAAFLVQEKVAEPAAIDAIFKEGYGHAMGPLETADLIGLDTVANSLKILYDSFQDPKFRCCPLLQKMVDAGLLGRKSGRGFYSY